MEFWKIIGKVASTLSAILVILLFFGIVLSSHVRSNFFAFGELLLSSGPIGILVLFILLWNLKGIPSTFQKLFKAKGFNSRFWNDL